MNRKLRSLAGRIIVKLLLLDKPSWWSFAFTQKLLSNTFTVLYQSKRIRFIATNKVLYYRASTLFSKEPETISWIENMPANQVLFDVGANIGVYSIFAGFKGHTVMAFEPVCFNCAQLNKNIFINGLGSKVSVYPIAIADNMQFDTIRLRDLEDGSASHTFGSNLDTSHHEFKPVFTQGSLSFSLDELVYKYNFPCPQYLKIDVDGLEHKVITGARQVLKDARLRSILIELNKNLAVDEEIITHLQTMGFTLQFEGTKRNGVGNYIFYR